MTARFWGKGEEMSGYELNDRFWIHPAVDEIQYTNQSR